MLRIRDHLWRWSTYFGRDIPTEIRRSETGSEKEKKNGKSRSNWLGRFNRKMSFYFSSGMTGRFWHNGKHPGNEPQKSSCAVGACGAS